MADNDNPIIRAYGPRTSGASLTLYERMGGEQKLETIVDGVYKLMRDDKVIGKQFARFRLERLKDRTVDYLRGEFGGEAYTSSDLWISHSHLGVRNDWYDIMMKYYVKMLKKVRMPKAETEEILASLENMRKPIVDPGQKLKEMYLRHCEKEDEKVGGSGWTVKPEKWEENHQALQAMPAQKPGQKPVQKPTAPDPASQGEQSALPGAVATSPVASGDDDSKPAAGAKAKAKAKAKAQMPESRRYNFRPKSDEPPEPMPSSMPSGSELLYRLSNRPMSIPAAVA